MELKKILETCLYTEDLKATRDFYVKNFGLIVYGEEPGRHVFFKLPDGGMLLFFDPRATATAGQLLPPHYASGRQHLAFEVSDGDYEAWKQKLKAVSAIEHEQVWASGARSFYFRDNNGHLLEIGEAGIWL